MHLIQALILENHAKMIGLQRIYMLQPFFLYRGWLGFAILLIKYGLQIDGKIILKYMLS
jgi:hypothetical protein